MRTRHGITQIRGFQGILHESQLQSFLDEHPEVQKRWNVIRPIFDKTITIEAAADVFNISESPSRRRSTTTARRIWGHALSITKEKTSCSSSPTRMRRNRMRSLNGSIGHSRRNACLGNASISRNLSKSSKNRSTRGSSSTTRSDHMKASTI